MTNKFNEKKRKYEETIDNLKKQIEELKSKKKIKTKNQDVRKHK